MQSRSSVTALLQKSPPVCLQRHLGVDVGAHPRRAFLTLTHRQAGKGNIQELGCVDSRSVAQTSDTASGKERECEDHVGGVAHGIGEACHRTLGSRVRHLGEERRLLATQ